MNISRAAILALTFSSSLTVADDDATRVFDIANKSVVTVSRHAWVSLKDITSHELGISEEPISGGSGVMVKCPIDYPAGLLDGLTGEERAEDEEYYLSGEHFGGICVLTNCHVVGQAGPIVISSDGVTIQAGRGLQNYPSDFCMISRAWRETEILRNPPAKVGSSRTLKVGDQVYAIGNPSGLTDTLTTGIVSGFRDRNGVRLIQISAPISPGSSGGGLFNNKGELIGLTTAKIVGGEGLAFAIPIELFDSLWQVAYKRSERRSRIREEHIDSMAFRAEAAEDWLGLLDLAKTWIEIDEWDAGAWEALGTAYSRLHERDEAIEAFERSIEIDPVAGGKAKLGAVYLIDGMVADGSEVQNREYVTAAVGILESAVGTNPYEARAWGTLALAYALGQWPERALEAASKSIELDGQMRIAWTACGRAYLDLEMMREAFDCLKTSTRLEPRNSIDWWYLGLAAKRLGEDGAVLEVYRQLRQLDPERAELFFELLE